MGFEESAFESLGDSQESWVLYGIAGITPDGGACERLSAEERREWRRLSAVERREVRAMLEEELLSLDLQRLYTHCFRTLCVSRLIRLK